MDYKEIIEEGHLVYASRPGDKSFREWRIDKTACLVNFFKTYELTKLDSVILLTLEANDSKLYENQLAKILGFNVENDFHVTPKRYADKGEIGIFQQMLNEVESFGLIFRQEKEVSLTHLGRLSIKTGKKYTFHRGIQALMQSFDIAQKEDKDFKYFPFRDALGLTSNIQGEDSVGYDAYNKNDIGSVMFENPSELVKRLMLQTITDTAIFVAKESQESRMSEASVDFRLYEYEGQKYPLVFYKDDISVPANDLLFKDCNSEYIGQKVHIGEYLYLVRESEKPLNYNSLSPYFDIWNLEDILESIYLDWSDRSLFEKIADKANGAQWNTISLRCPIEDLKCHLNKYKDSLDWITLSERYDDEFILTNTTLYPWDYESLSENRSIDFVKKLIVIEELHKDVDWNWEIILSKIDDDFVIEHIGSVPFEMYSVTQKYLTKYPSIIVGNPGRRWNWDLISNEADLDYILTNITAFADEIHLEAVMPRAFSDNSWADLFSDSGEFAFAVVKHKEWLQNQYNANEAQYIWTPKVIDWHEKFGFIFWKSPSNSKGLECNKHIIWNNDIFDRYHDREFSLKGLNHISQSISTTAIIDAHPDFKWSWAILSTRDIVFSDFDFIKRHIRQLSFESVLPKIEAQQITQLYGIDSFKEIATEQNIWGLVTKYIEKSTILNNLHRPEWDWHIITENFCDTLNFSKLDELSLIDKLDWNYISGNADTDKIERLLAEYIERWNWETITRRLDHDYIIENLTDYYKYWDWGYVISTVFTNEDLTDTNTRVQTAIVLSQLDEEYSEKLWVLLTARYSTKEIFDYSDNKTEINFVPYKWNYSDVYNRQDFDIDQYLKDYKEKDIYVDWDALSASKPLNRLLKRDNKIIKDFRLWEEIVKKYLNDEDYKWNFKYLSTLSSINWCDSILSIRAQEWDWTYLSENSGCFNTKKVKDLERHIEKFSDFLDFGILSKRKDLKMPLDSLIKLSRFQWDWFAISSNFSYELNSDFIQGNYGWNWDWKSLSSRKECVFTKDFIRSHSSFDWDWQALSKRKDITFDSDCISALTDKDWNWNELTKRIDIEYTDDLLSKIVDKDINWREFCHRTDFYPNLHTLSLLKGKDLDWDYISKRAELPYEVIVVYKDKLNWKTLSSSHHIDKSKPKVLETFKDYLDWSIVSYSADFNLSLENLEQFKDYIKWPIICKRQDFIVDMNILVAYEDKLDWQRISRMNIAFTQEMIDRFKDRWDWVALSENPSFRSSGIEKSYKMELNLMEFYNELKGYSCGKPFIYHFTHMFNAIEVMKSRKILSRNRATELGLLKYDAAGSVVHRSSKAHPYARFYYRTGTQTQFYNECLGKQYNTKYYESARGNGLPMCPMPVFFKFDLQEVLTKFPNLCSYSTGNLQTNWARIYKVIEDPANIDAYHLYSSNNYEKVVRDKKQQEFLIKSEFDFSKLNDYQIICYDREETEILRSLFQNDPIREHIYCVYETENVFEKENPPLRFEISDTRVDITTSYRGEFMFQIESEHINKIKVVNKNSIKTEKKNIIQLREYVSVECGDVPFEVYYVNLSPDARSPRWLIYQHTPKEIVSKNTDTETIENYLGISFEDDVFSPEELIVAIELAFPKFEPLYNTKVRHYVTKTHTLLVCQQFEKYAFRFNAEEMNLDLMRIILAIHDIGKAVDRATQHEQTISLIREFWEETPFTDYELMLAESLLKDNHLGYYFQQKYDLEPLKNEIIEDAKALNIAPGILLQYKMILYQCDVASYTKDAGGLKYLEHLFEYKDGEKNFDETEGLICMSPEYKERYNNLKSSIV